MFRTTEEIQSGELQWPFWTKLVVVAIGIITLLRKKHPRIKTFSEEEKKSQKKKNPSQKKTSQNKNPSQKEKNPRKETFSEKKIPE